jgi:hypothetical protein
MSDRDTTTLNSPVRRAGRRRAAAAIALTAALVGLGGTAAIATPAPDAPAPVAMAAKPGPVSDWKVTYSRLEGGRDKDGYLYASVKVKTILGIPYKGVTVWFHDDTGWFPIKTRSNGVAKNRLGETPDRWKIEIQAHLFTKDGPSVKTVTGEDTLTLIPGNIPLPTD